ncbi:MULTISPECIES: Uma2 family endonuclease [Synechocystis]|uniref:Uma2 family endonuclease n=1 Tax=Synechocystis salina LEGE 00031 TaxID=1828736 RepID=A0ABR9VZD3_9SYNC|nr:MULTISPECIES: Uma2 family endonuclease [Synechocystis]MBE9195608.1 Uma2 family endonuclease [Synechocystis sp. LEGE 06083]MBE9241637.1 Uma2 family endonuclease [Synechocystis salina LEGE 00041]MBE9255606.1 Uma2 family endonuclease [Synechocystis salina LEGE 00031]
MATLTQPVRSIDQDPLLLDVSHVTLKISPEHFDQLCLDNPDLRLELTKDGNLIVMAPAGGETSRKNLDLAIDVGLWNRQTNLGQAFDSSCGYDFTALGGGKLSPDVSWIEQSKLGGVEIVGFIAVVPNFVIELRSATDNLKPLQEKMQEYRRLGVQLGLLINPQNQQVEIYRPAQETEVLTSPQKIDCDEVMPGFVLDLTRIW